MNRNFDKNQKNLISIIIVNWNSGFQLLEVILSIKKYHSDLVTEVIIVDNASTDNSISQIECFCEDENLGFKFLILRNSLNLGFGAACNQGSKRAISPYLLFLNPDTRLFNNSLTVPINLMQEPLNKTIGICGISLVDEYGKPTTSVSRFPTLRVMLGKILCLTNLFPKLFPAHLMLPNELTKSGFVDQIIGAFFLIRTDLFESCEGFDERFFVYFEEVDLSLRAKHLGFSSYFLSNATAFHKGGGCSEQVKAARLFYSLRSRILYAQKHYSFNEFIILVLLTGFELPLRITQGLIKLSIKDIKNTLIGYIYLFNYFSSQMINKLIKNK